MLIFQGVLPQFLTSLIRSYGLCPRYVRGEGTVFHVVLGSLRAVLTPRAPILLQYLDRSQIGWNFWQDRKVLFEGLEAITLPETNIAPETLGVGRWVSLWEGLLTGAMLVFGSVYALLPMFFVVAYLATWLTTKWTKGKFRAKWKTVATTEFRDYNLWFCSPNLNRKCTKHLERWQLATYSNVRHDVNPRHGL